MNGRSTQRCCRMYTCEIERSRDLHTSSLLLLFCPTRTSTPTSTAYAVTSRCRGLNVTNCLRARSVSPFGLGKNVRTLVDGLASSVKSTTGRQILSLCGPSALTDLSRRAALSYETESAYYHKTFDAVFSGFWRRFHRVRVRVMTGQPGRARSATGDAALHGSPEKAHDVDGGAGLFAGSPAAEQNG